MLLIISYKIVQNLNNKFIITLFVKLLKLLSLIYENKVVDTPLAYSWKYLRY